TVLAILRCGYCKVSVGFDISKYSLSLSFYSGFACLIHSFGAEENMRSSHAGSTFVLASHLVTDIRRICSDKRTVSLSGYDLVCIGSQAQGKRITRSEGSKRTLYLRVSAYQNRIVISSFKLLRQFIDSGNNGGRILATWQDAESYIFQIGGISHLEFFL